MSTNEALNEAGPLPNNWGPIFGLHGIQERLGDLSWLGENYADMGWIKIDDSEISALETASPEHIAWEKAKQALRDSDWTMLPDVPMLAGEKDAWVSYRKALREIRSQNGFPHDIQWPIAPE